MARFEKVSKYKDDAELVMPKRKTAQSAGYDMVAAEDYIIPSYFSHLHKLDGMKDAFEDEIISLEDMAARTKSLKAKPTLISTGMKCHLLPDEYLELSVRSSSPLKYWLILANGVGIIDADYYDNPDNEGEIFFQIINLSPYDIIIQKGEAIGQGIIKNYLITQDDDASGKRLGGFGSTDR